MKDPVVSIVVPVQKGCASLGQCLEAVMRQSCQNKEVVIVCDPRAATREVLPQGSEDVRIIRERSPSSLPHLINTGMRASRGHFKIMLMPECVPVGDRWLSSMTEPFEDEGVGVVVGRSSPFPDSRPGLAVRLLECLSPCRQAANQKGRGKPQLISHRCDAYRASLLADIGYFSENLPSPGEAVETSLRVADAGYSIVVSDSAVAAYRTSGEYSLLGALRRAFEHGRSDGMLERQYDLRWLNAGVFAVALFSLLLVPVALVSLPIAMILGLGLFAWGWFLSLRIPFLRWEYPLALLNFAIFAALVLLTRDGWRPHAFGTDIHPALLRQWFWVACIVATYVLLMGKSAVGGALRAWRQPRGLLFAVPIGLLSVAWWLVAGAGYLRGAFLDSVSKK